MTSDELKKKIAEIIDNAFENRCRKTNCHNCDLYPDEMCQPNMYADALIAAGIRFGENLTATFDHMALQREHELECRLAEAEHRAEVAEKALDKACADMGQLMDCCRWAANGGVITIEEYTPEKATPRAYKKRAEKELAEGKKE